MTKNKQQPNETASQEKGNATFSPGIAILALLFLAMIPLSYLLQLHEQLRQFLAPEISLARPQVILLLWAIPGVALLLKEWHKVHRSRFARFASDSLYKQLVPSYSGPRRRIKGWLLSIALAFLVLAWAAPQWGTKVRILKRRGIDVILAVDLSESMLAKDAPTASVTQKQRRLHLARRKVRVMMEMLGNERIGIIAFAGKPIVLCPLTTDHNACASWLESYKPSLIPYGGTALATTIKKAIPMFATSGHNSRALVILSDGDDHEKNTLKAAKEARKKGIRIYTLGFGSPKLTTIPASQLPPPEPGQRPDNRPIQTRLNEKLLKKIAVQTKGIYRKAEASHRDIKSVHEHAKRFLKARTHKSRRLIIREERFAVFASIGLLFLIFFWSFRESKE